MPACRCVFSTTLNQAADSARHESPNCLSPSVCRMIAQGLRTQVPKYPVSPSISSLPLVQNTARSFLPVAWQVIFNLGKIGGPVRALWGGWARALPETAWPLTDFIQTFSWQYIAYMERFEYVNCYAFACISEMLLNCQACSPNIQTLSWQYGTFWICSATSREKFGYLMFYVPSFLTGT